MAKLSYGLWAVTLVVAAVACSTADESSTRTGRPPESSPTTVTSTRVISAGACDIVIIGDAAQLLMWTNDIVTATVEEVGPGGGTPIYTPIRVRVNDVLSGDEAPGAALVVRLYGGTADGVVQESNGPAVPEPGDERLLMLRDRPGIGSHHVFDMMPIDDAGILRYSGELGCSPMKQMVGTPLAALAVALGEAEDKPAGPPATLEQVAGTTTPTVRATATND